MKKTNSNILLSFLLLLTSFLIYLIQVVQFHDLRNTVFYLFQDMAFVPLQVVIVTILLNKILSSREKSERLKKMNMVISVFFGEAGNDIIIMLLKFNTNIDNLKSNLNTVLNWSNEDFQKEVKLIKNYDFTIDIKPENLSALKALLLERRHVLLTMFENPNMLEHDTFTDMLWSVFHITDELLARDSFNDLKDIDIEHLSIDIKRAFSTLLIEWINYMAHLKSDYPYLFSMAVRKNPFNNNCCK